MSDLTITLTGEAADKLRKLVADQRYARAEDAIAEALDALEASRDPALEAWLRDVITARAEANAADPARSLTADEVRAQLIRR
jgi:Arc/MetJ-type ribon-helix-helix transcriptional regulator